LAVAEEHAEQSGWHKASEVSCSVGEKDLASRRCLGDKVMVVASACGRGEVEHGGKRWPLRFGGDMATAPSALPRRTHAALKAICGPGLIRHQAALCSGPGPVTPHLCQAVSNIQILSNL
jgi:hypothetical protein